MKGYIRMSGSGDRAEVVGEDGKVLASGVLEVDLGARPEGDLPRGVSFAAAVRFVEVASS